MRKNISKLFYKYKNMSVAVKATLWFTICSIVQRGIGMLTTPIFTRLLPTEEYGLYSTYLSWESVLFMIVTLCLYKSMMNLYVKYDNHEKVLADVCGLEICLSLFWLVIGIVFRNQIASSLKLTPALVICLFVYFMFQAVIQCWSLYKRYKFQYRSLVIVTLIISVGTSLLSACAVAFIKPTAEMRAIANSAVIAIIGFMIYMSVFKKAGNFYSGRVWTFALGFCIPLMPHYLSEFILQSSDKIMINYMCGSREVAIYSIAYSTGSLITLVTNAINSSFAPYQYQKIKAGQYNALSKRANQVLIFVGAMLVGIMLFSREIVLLFGGHKYEESAVVIIPICLGVYFNYMFQLFARVQEYYERKATVVIPSILCAILNLLLNYIFIRIYGYQAAAYTTFACYLVFCIVHYFFYRKVCKEVLDGKQLYDIKVLILISIGVIIIGMIISFVNHFYGLKYSIIGVFFVISMIKRKQIINAVKTIILNP